MEPHLRKFSNPLISKILKDSHVTARTYVSSNMRPDSCHNKISADQYHVTILRAQVDTLGDKEGGRANAKFGRKLTSGVVST